MKERTLRRHMKRLMTKNEKVIEADRRFFLRRPGRHHRIRLASANEVEMHLRASGAKPDLREGERLFAVVRNVVQGFRLRAFFPGPAANAAHCDDIAEDEAAWLFECMKAAQPRIACIEKNMAAAVSESAGGAA